MKDLVLIYELIEKLGYNNEGLDINDLIKIKAKVIQAIESNNKTKKTTS